MVLVESLNWIADRLRQNILDPLTNTISGRAWIIQTHATQQDKNYPRIGMQIIDAPQQIAYLDDGLVESDEKSRYHDITVQLNVDVLHGTEAIVGYESRNFEYPGTATNALLKNMISDNVIELLETLGCGGATTQSINSNMDVIRLDNINAYDRDETDEEVVTSRIIFQGVYRKVIRFRLRVESRRT